MVYTSRRWQIMTRSVFQQNNGHRARISSRPYTFDKVFRDLTFCQVVVDPELLRDLAQRVFGILFKDIWTERPA